MPVSAVSLFGLSCFYSLQQLAPFPCIHLFNFLSLRPDIALFPSCSVHLRTKHCFHSPLYTYLPCSSPMMFPVTQLHSPPFKRSFYCFFLLICFVCFLILTHFKEIKITKAISFYQKWYHPIFDRDGQFYAVVLNYVKLCQDESFGIIY